MHFFQIKNRPQKLWWQHIWPCLQNEIRLGEVLAAVLQPALSLVAEATQNEYETYILPTFRYFRKLFFSNSLCDQHIFSQTKESKFRITTKNQWLVLQSRFFSTKINPSNGYYSGKSARHSGENAARWHSLRNSSTFVQCIWKFNDSSAGQ